MEKSQYQIMSRVEDSHFWYRGMRRITQNILDGYINKKNNQILDAGCGTGANLIFLKQYGKVVGIDISKEAIKLCRSRGLKTIQIGTINDLPFADNSFDLITCFDVLGQKGVDRKKAISEFFRVLKPKGLLFLRVAAYQFLYSFHDKVVHTERRYTKKDLLQIIKINNFSILKLSYINMLLFPLTVIRRIIFKNKSDHQSDVFAVSNWLNYLLLIPLLIESLLIRYLEFPFGLSLIALVKSNKILYNKGKNYGIKN